LELKKNKFSKVVYKNKAENSTKEMKREKSFIYILVDILIAATVLP